MTAHALARLAAGQPERYDALAAALAGPVGLTCLVAWVASLGFLAELLSRPVLVGYLRELVRCRGAARVNDVADGRGVDGYLRKEDSGVCPWMGRCRPRRTTTGR